MKLMRLAGRKVFWRSMARMFRLWKILYSVEKATEARRYKSKEAALGHWKTKMVVWKDASDREELMKRFLRRLLNIALSKAFVRWQEMLATAVAGRRVAWKIVFARLREQVSCNRAVLLLLALPSLSWGALLTALPRCLHSSEPLGLTGRKTIGR